MPELSLCATAMLLVIADEDLTVQGLRSRIPPGDVAEWFDQLEAILTRGYVIRVTGRGEYLYRLTSDGAAFLREHVSAWRHPVARRLRSVA